MSHSNSFFRKVVALVVLSSFTVGCVSVKTTGTQPARGEGGGLQVSVFPDDEARKARIPGPREVASELARHENGRWIPIFKSLSPSWAVTDLPPGKYRVHFTSVLDETGQPRALDSRPKTLRIRKGEVTQVETTLEHVSKGWIVAGVFTAVVAAVLLADALDDLPVPPLPSPELVELAVVATDITLEIAAAEAWSHEGPVARAPIVTSHFPEDGALVAARHLRVVFAVSEPLAPGVLFPEAVTVEAEQAGFVAGTVSYDPENWWIVWEPEAELPRGDVLHVFLDGRALRDFHGNEAADSARFSFETTP